MQNVCAPVICLLIDPGNVVMVLPLSQTQWVKATGTLANYVLVCGERGLRSLEALEQSMHLSPSTFRALEGLIVPADFEEVMKELEKLEKPTPSALREVATRVMSDRWIEWAILHPEIGSELIHPSRSMCPHPAHTLPTPMAVVSVNRCVRNSSCHMCHYPASSCYLVMCEQLLVKPCAFAKRRHGSLMLCVCLLHRNHWRVPGHQEDAASGQ